MHESSMLRMEWFVENHVKSGDRVLDVGSQDINGSYAELFKDCEYYGMDMTEGKNVDIVMETPYDWSDLETDSFDVVVCGQVFEHNEFFWLTMSEITRVLKKDGVVCIIVPSTQKEHRYPVDCYRFFTDGVVAMARYCTLDILHAHTNCLPPSRDKRWVGDINTDAIVIAKKGYSGIAKHIDVKTYTCVPPDQKELMGDFIKYKKRKKK